MGRYLRKVNRDDNIKIRSIFQTKLTYKIRTLRTKQQLSGEAKRHACILIYLHCSPNLSVWTEQNTSWFLRKRYKTLTEGERAWASTLCRVFNEPVSLVFFSAPSCDEGCNPATSSAQMGQRSLSLQTGFHPAQLRASP